MTTNETKSSKQAEKRMQELARVWKTMPGGNAARELVEGAVDLAASRYGLLGEMVLSSWGIRRPEDIGAITFALIQHGVFSKQPDDRLEDFVGHAGLNDAIRTAVRRRLGLEN